jgi:hypothetical protein
MFQLPSRFSELVLEHRHSDGSWGQLERSHHDPADHDPEREWRDRGLYVCTTCDEQVRLGIPADADQPEADG